MHESFFAYVREAKAGCRKEKSSTKRIIGLLHDFTLTRISSERVSRVMLEQIDELY